jgi:hypothetical protein
VAPQRLQKEIRNLQRRKGESGGNTAGESCMQGCLDRKINAKIPLEDYRKNAVSLILAPYLINIRKIPPDQANQSLIEWLERCNAVRRLDFRPRQRVKDSIKTAMKVKIPLLRLETLRSRNPELHRMIVLSIIE